MAAITTRPKISRLRALADYIAKFAGMFPCGDYVEPDASNVQFKRDYDHQRRPVWTVRCKNCNRRQARESMQARRLVEQRRR
jgi:hypothetical protein